ncbi:ParB/RepB/Spo0J family partition protein [Estrella lausannensis]|uniref:Putative chromosome-partitioning protein ParB n=1 Tax=Estrella lausannensis TaxID=483423 RepID=A0A0H5E6K3_9BACT|nr:ParB/RepB/Spo0J family partition protein [Estrella lausannensis]CRX38920.1 Putative chromosome-partitioning protein ParB [Estrella lausannensis]
MEENLIEVPLSAIKAGGAQPRSRFDEEELQELKTSIREIGLIHPPVVRLSQDGSYELISGERRFRAYSLLGKETIPVIVKSFDDKTAAIGSLVENIQRVDLNPIEVAVGIKRLMEEFQLSQQDVSLKIGKERSTVSNYLRILQLPVSIRDSLQRNTITMGHAKAILSVSDDHAKVLLHEAIVKDSLSVREAEKKAASLEKKVKERAFFLKQRDFHLEDIERRAEERLGTKVWIEGSAKKGRISITYHNLDDLDRILAILGIADSL